MIELYIICIFIILITFLFLGIVILFTGIYNLKNRNIKRYSKILSKPKRNKI